MSRALCFIVLAWSISLSAEARPPHKQALAQYFGPHLAKKLNDCRTCHVPDSKERKEEGEKAHNLFGARLERVKAELRKAGKKTTLEACLEAILNEDSDRDGQSNLTELLTGHNPGEKEDIPADAELAELKKTLVLFEKHRNGYPWRPFETVKRPPVPTVKNNAWARNTIDHFIAKEHEALGLTPRPQAPKAVLLRRLYLDLTGLPPTAADLNAFLEDAAPDAYEKVVERLLASPRYGERWGRHWMDVWRYSDWAGFGPQVRDSQPHIWRWRDWIIESLNEDKGYDRMVLEMLAGDELAPEDPRVVAGTGYLVRNFNLLSREKWMQDVVEHTSLAFLGVTIGCARCHDHMFDPFPQEDYYKMRAFFEPHQVRTDRVPGEPDVKKGGLPRAYDKDLTIATHLFIRGDDRTPDKSRAMVPGVPGALGGNFSKVETVQLPRFAFAPDRRSFVVQETIQTSQASQAKAKADVKTARTRIAQMAGLLTMLPEWTHLAPSTSIQSLEQTLELAEVEANLADTRHDALLRNFAAEKAEDEGMKDDSSAKAANAAQRRQAVAEARKKLLTAKSTLSSTADAGKKAAAQKAFDAASKELAKAEADVKLPPSPVYTKRTSATYPAQSTGRRLALARWIADRDNPLSARVAVNHIWLRHFGQGIVPSVFDFGRNGRAPTHPALLDWLAVEFMEQKWSMKHLHRLIVNSATYRQASTPEENNTRLDRDNKYLWRYPPRRVEAEVVRDSIFHVAGKLELTMGGPDIDYPLGLTVPRRSLYFRHAAEKQMEFLLLFDAAAVSECYERKHSIIPQQALALFNSDLSLRHSRILARSLASKSGDAATFVKGAFEQILTRGPTSEETGECVMFLTQETARLRETKIPGPTSTTPDGALPSSDPALRAREHLVHVLMNHHEFVTIR